MMMMMIDEKLKPLDGVKTTTNAQFYDIAESQSAWCATVKKNAFTTLHNMKRPMELLRLIREASSGQHLAMGKLREAVSSGDFPLLFQSISQASMLGQYADLPQQWPTFSSRTTVPDFRPARLVRWDAQMQQAPDYNAGADRHVRALPRVAELTEYPTFNLTTEGTDYFVNKYGARFPFSWEAFLNDELRVLQELPSEMARWARDTEDVLTTGVLATADGPNPDFFSSTENFGTQAPVGNYVEDNPPLSLKAVEEAIAQIGMRQVAGRQVRVQDFVLLVPPSLALTAHAIAQSTTYVHVQRLATDEEIRTNVSSPVAGRFTVVESPWLPLIDRSATASTTWYLVPAGGTTDRGPAIVTAFLRGHEAPDVRVMGDTGRALGGGDVSAFEGSFSHDDVQYRVRSIVGAAGIDSSAVAVSKGDGTATGTGGSTVRPLMDGPIIPMHETTPSPQGFTGTTFAAPASAPVDMDALRAQIRDEVRAEMEAQRRAADAPQGDTGTKAEVKPEAKQEGGNTPRRNTGGSTGGKSTGK